MSIACDSNCKPSDSNQTETKMNHLLVGDSTVVVKLIEKINLVANNHLPILINGASGTGKTLAAQLLHESSLGKAGPLIISDCQYWQQSKAKTIMGKIWQEAQGGSLLLKNVDALDIEDAQSIKSYWFEGINSKHTKYSAERKTSAVRLMVSSGALSRASQQRWHINHSFMAWLDYHSLSIELAILANRVSDIAALVNYFGKMNPEINKLSFNSDSWQIITNYSWPGNIKQLLRCLEKLAILVGDETISAELLLQYFPAMNPQSENIISTEITSQKISDSKDENIIGGGEKISDVPISFSTQLTASSKQKLHPALLRALKYIDENFTQVFSMAKLADQAYVSPSHLSALFKKQLGQSFKQVLLRMRINEAVRLFNLHPERHVTQVCDDVGFSDLSFFEKRFKSQVGVSPGVYRDQFCKPRHLHTID